jgi:hypothetical protein
MKEINEVTNLTVDNDVVNETSEIATRANGNRGKGLIVVAGAAVVTGVYVLLKKTKERREAKRIERATKLLEKNDYIVTPKIDLEDLLVDDDSKEN